MATLATLVPCRLLLPTGTLPLAPWALPPAVTKSCGCWPPARFVLRLDHELHCAWQPAGVGQCFSTRLALFFHVVVLALLACESHKSWLFVRAGAAGCEAHCE